jgi:hypothetical protein
MSKSVDERGYPLKPRKIGKDGKAWFYETRRGVEVCIVGRDNQTVVATLSWKQIECAAMRRLAIKVESL